MLSIARSKLKVLCNNISFVSRSVKANYFIQTQVEHPTLLDYFILVYLFIGGWWREDFPWWRVRWWRDRSLLASSLVASLPGGEVTGNREVMAESVVGIAWTFLGAAARSVVALWTIGDEGILEFMSFFYDALAKGKKASEALNQAMKCMRDSETFKEVKYWVPFVLIGDDVKLDFKDI